MLLGGRGGPHPPKFPPLSPAVSSSSQVAAASPVPGHTEIVSSHPGLDNLETSQAKTVVFNSFSSQTDLNYSQCFTFCQKLDLEVATSNAAQVEKPAVWVAVGWGITATCNKGLRSPLPLGWSTGGWLYKG